MPNLLADLAHQALEMREDYGLSKIAEAADIRGARTYSHEDAWNGTR